MTFPIDLTQWRVYSAEQSLPSGQWFEDLEEARTYLWWVQSTRWFKTSFPDAPTVRLELGGNTGDDAIQSYAQTLSASDALISLHPRMMNSVVLLHEVAHCVAPKSFGDLKAISQGKISSGKHHAHGEYFRAAFCALAERYKIGVDPQELRRAYEHFELGTPDLESLITARAHSTEVKVALAEMWERHEREWATDPKHLEMQERAKKAGNQHRAKLADKGISVEPRIPADWWGSWLWLARRHTRPRLSQQQLADAVSPLVKCSARDVARLERGEKPHKEIDQLRCLAFVAVLNLDPVWIETHKGLAPGESTFTLDALQTIAPEWVSDVRHLNALLDARPPRWDAPGDR